jgi:hypothetical protein
MPETQTITLTDDPALRESLRHLYPELPPWARVWITPAPGAPLAQPPGHLGGEDDSIAWQISRGTTLVGGDALRGERLAFRYLRDIRHGNSSDKGPFQVTFADGTGAYLLLTRGAVDHKQPIKPESGTREDAKHRMSIYALLRRFQMLTSGEDRARIAAFWMGHRHPILAAAGLAVMPQDTPTNTTHTSVPPSAGRQHRHV